MTRVLIRSLLSGVSLAALTCSAYAADMPVKAPPPLAVAAPSWNDVYLGLDVGFGFPKDPTGVDSVVFTPPGKGAGPSSASGSFGENNTFPFFGLEIGQHHQFSPNFVLGWSADINWSPLTYGRSRSGDLVLTSGPGTLTVSQENRMTWFGTVQGQAGYLITPDFLIFGAGGFAYGHVTNDLSASLIASNNTSNLSDSGGNTRTGWTVGGGFEWKLDQHWSFKTEYQYVNLADTSRTVLLTVSPGKSGNPVTGAATINDKNEFQMVKFSLNYSFWTP